MTENEIELLALDLLQGQGYEYINGVMILPICWTTFALI